MTVRIAHRLAREHSSSPCARCLSIVDVAAGQWHATEPGDLDRPVCDRCAERGDHDGYAHLLAWRRMRGYCPGAAPTERGR